MEESTIQSKLNEIIKLLKGQAEKPMSFREACKYLHITPSYLYKLTSLKSIKFYKPMGKLIYFKKSELDNWIFNQGNNTTE